MLFVNTSLTPASASYLLVTRRRFCVQITAIFLAAVYWVSMCPPAAAEPLPDTRSVGGNSCQLTSRSPSFPETTHTHLVWSLDLIQLREVSDVSLSPDGRLVVFQLHRALVGSNSLCTRWYAIRIDGRSRPKALTGAGNPPWDEIGQWQSSKPT